jgi:hypothetical protein
MIPAPCSSPRAPHAALRNPATIGRKLRPFRQRRLESVDALAGDKVRLCFTGGDTAEVREPCAGPHETVGEQRFQMGLRFFDCCRRSTCWLAQTEATPRYGKRCAASLRSRASPARRPLPQRYFRRSDFLALGFFSALLPVSRPSIDYCSRLQSQLASTGLCHNLSPCAGWEHLTAEVRRHASTHTRKGISNLRCGHLRSTLCHAFRARRHDDA